MAVRRPGACYKPAVRVVSVLCALGFMFAYSLSKAPTRTATEEGHGQEEQAGHVPLSLNTHKSDSVLSWKVASRHLLAHDVSYIGEDSSGDSIDEFNLTNSSSDSVTPCFSPRDEHVGYNSSCDYVLDQCGDEAQLFNYLRFILCNLAPPIRVRMTAEGVWHLN